MPFSFSSKVQDGRNDVLIVDFQNGRIFMKFGMHIIISSDIYYACVFPSWILSLCSYTFSLVSLLRSDNIQSLYYFPNHVNVVW